MHVAAVIPFSTIDVSGVEQPQNLQTHGQQLWMITCHSAQDQMAVIKCLLRIAQL